MLFLQDLTLLMTKSFLPEQVNIKLSLVTEEDNNTTSKPEVKNSGNATAPNQTTPNRLLVLFFQSTDNISKILYVNYGLY